ncbi:MAG: hypothetical protein FJY73_05660 [Candidatus Eisenbacteria bacterium]|nr:hypothetical protein [Candidatus Eisenbacteria bacterium]
MDSPDPRERNDTPRRSRKISADADETFEFLSDDRNLPSWWGSGAEREEEGAEGLHMDADPGARAVHLRWGSPGMWRHMVASVAPDGPGSRVTIQFVPVPGCDGVCLDREILRAGGSLRRLARLLDRRAHLVDTDHYWL